MTDQPASASARAMRSSLNAWIMQVEPHNVLAAGNAIRAEATLIADQIQHARLEAVVREPGRDPVSLDAAPRFNATIQAQFGESLAIADELQRAADTLAQSARHYGHTEQAIRASFTQYQLAHPPPAAPGQLPGHPPRPS